mmetsp:Transcript_23793/g.54221  ORF Transcript_23793/g.54221 Transcript_23793/m.54221 type:complete len:161 (-) Transcript_23793:239-721(-)
MPRKTNQNYQNILKLINNLPSDSLSKWNSAHDLCKMLNDGGALSVTDEDITSTMQYKGNKANGNFDVNRFNGDRYYRKISSSSDSPADKLGDRRKKISRLHFHKVGLDSIVKEFGMICHPTKEGTTSDKSFLPIDFLEDSESLKEKEPSSPFRRRIPSIP